MLPQLVNTGFQVLFHSPHGVLFTFPSRYCALSVTEEYLALRGGPRSFPQGFTCLVVLWILPPFGSLRLRGSHPLRPAFPGPFCWVPLWLMQSEPHDACAMVWALSISLAATLEITFVFSSSGYLDVSVHRVPSVKLWIHLTVPEVLSGGFPHSDIRGSMDICSSPRLFAAYHVFLRLSVPRHPPCALSCLTNLSFAELSVPLRGTDIFPLSRFVRRYFSSCFPSLSRRIAFRLWSFGSRFYLVCCVLMHTVSDVSIFRQA